jgi:hypothetical protein
MSAVLISCGGGRTPIDVGQDVSGVINAGDSHWTSCDSEDYCNDGYSDRYEVDVVAGTSYTVTFVTASAGINFEDLEHGRITDSVGASSTSSLSVMDAPLTWVPAKSGTNRIGIYTTSEYLPASYSFTISTR